MSSKPHFLLFPFVEHGHSNPMLSLASQLAALGCKVTFVKVPAAAQDSHSGSPGANTSVLPAWERIRIVTLAPLATPSSASTIAPESTSTPPEMLAPLVTPSSASTIAPESTSMPTLKPEPPPIKTAESLIPQLRALQMVLAGLEKKQGIVERLVEESKSTPHPISCLITDVFMWEWVSNLAAKHGLQAAMFNVLGTLFFYTHYLGQQGKEAEIEDLVSHFSMPNRDDPATGRGLLEINTPERIIINGRKLFEGMLKGLKSSNLHILLNSFEHLEAPLLPSLLGSGLSVRFVGPCFPARSTEDDVGVGSIFTEQEACFSWLDKQEEGSVLFVAFGSRGTIEKNEQVEELAMGIAESGQKFLWAVRPDAPASSRPSEEFRERYSKQGMFGAWLPQRKVLEHAAVGGFLTHCGWNSLLESVMAGVPMVCMPLFGDHTMAANLIHFYLQVGLRLAPGPDGLIGRAEVAKKVQAIMMHNASSFSHRASQLQQAAQFATLQAPHTLASFVQAIAQAASQP